MTDLQAIRNATDIGVLASSYGLKLRKTAGGFNAQCCFHNEKSASLRIHTAGKHKGRFKCFGCHASGDVLDFVQRLDSCDLPTAVRRLAADAGITLTDKPETAQERRQRERDKLEREMCGWWMRERWKEARRGLNRAMRAWEAGNPFADDLAGIYGVRLRWIERERKSDVGMAEFRKSGVTEREYRNAMKAVQRMNERKMVFLAWAFSAIEKAEQTPGNPAFEELRRHATDSLPPETGNSRKSLRS